MFSEDGSALGDPMSSMANYSDHGHTASLNDTQSLYSSASAAGGRGNHRRSRKATIPAVQVGWAQARSLPRHA